MYDFFPKPSRGKYYGINAILRKNLYLMNVVNDLIPTDMCVTSHIFIYKHIF